MAAEQETFVDVPMSGEVQSDGPKPEEISQPVIAEPERPHESAGEPRP